MKTIRGRLLLILFTGLAVVLAAGGAALYWIAAASLTRQFDEGLRSRAQTLAALVKFEPDNLVFESGDAPAAVVAETYFELRTESGGILKRSANLGEATLPARQPANHDPLFANTVLPGSLNGRLIWLEFQPRIDPDDWTGRNVNDVHPEVLVVAAAMDRSPIDRALAAVFTALCVVGAAIAVSAGLLVSVGVRYGLKPLERLSSQIGRFGGRAMAGRLNAATAPRELLPVYRELNSMLDRIEQTLDRERLFIDAAAHELRTPLAELRTLAEVALKWPNHDRLAAAVQEATVIGREMERLVESLLLISRGHPIACEGGSSEASLASIIDKCLKSAEPIISEKRLSVSVELAPEQSDVASAQSSGAVAMIVRNLIDNATNYTPLGGRIDIRGNATVNGSPWLVVENGPVDLNAGDLPRLFEPFWRGDASRSDRHHAGLGLAVVRQVAGAVGLRVEATLAGDRLQMSVSSRHGV